MTARREHTIQTTALLACGILSPLLYVGMNIFIAMQWDGYSSSSQTVSELSAIGAPTRSLWVLLGFVYSFLVAAFGLGVWKSASKNEPLRIVGGLLMASGIIGLGWPPMHQRVILAAGGGTITDILHLLWSAVTVLLFVLAIAFGATAFGQRFLSYSMLTIVIFVIFGFLTARQAPNLAADLPTPLIGVWERIDMGALMLWIAILAIAILRSSKIQSIAKVHIRDLNNSIVGYRK